MTEPYVFDHDLKCCWGKWCVIEPGRLALYIKFPNSTDMGGAIRVGRRLMPDVQEIFVFSGDDLDIIYRYDGEAGGWEGHCQRYSTKTAQC